VCDEPPNGPPRDGVTEIGLVAGPFFLGCRRDARGSDRLGTNELIYFGLRERLLPCWARARLSPKAIVRVKDGWLDEYEAWQKRDLSVKRYVYFWADGVYLTADGLTADCWFVTLSAPRRRGRRGTNASRRQPDRHCD